MAHLFETFEKPYQIRQLKLDNNQHYIEVSLT